MTKILFPLALIGSLVASLPQLAMAQSDLPEESTGSFSIDQFHESYDGELQSIAQKFLSEYVPPESANELSPCQEEGAKTIADYCGEITEDSHPIYVWCKAAFETGLMNKYANPLRKYTIFAPSKAGFVNYYTELARTQNVPHETLMPILEYMELEGNIYGPNQLWCKKKYITTTDRIAGHVKPPKIICLNDINGDPVTFLRGSDKESQKVFTPQFENPGDPIKVCNANIYPMNNMVLYKIKGSNEGKGRKRRNRRNKNNGVTTAPVSTPIVGVAEVAAAIPAPLAPAAPVPAPVAVVAPIPSPIAIVAPVPAPVAVEAPVPAPVAVEAPVPAPVAVVAPVPSPIAVEEAPVAATDPIQV